MYCVCIVYVSVQVMCVCLCVCKYTIYNVTNKACTIHYTCRSYLNYRYK